MKTSIQTTLLFLLLWLGSAFGQTGNVQFDRTTKALTQPSAAEFRSANGILPTRTFSNAAARAAAVPQAIGQVGYQLDDGSVWFATGTSAGLWVSTISVLDELLTPLITVGDSDVPGSINLYDSDGFAATFTFGGTAARSITFGDFAGEVTINTATQALTNKTYNGLTIIPSAGTLSITSGKTLSFTNTITLGGTDATNFSFPSTSGGTVLTTNSTATVTNKSISGSTNTLTNIPLTTAVTGVLPAANGGTGLDTSATVADRFLYTSGIGTWASGGVTSFARSFLDDSDAASVRQTLLLQGNVSVAEFYDGFATDSAELVGRVSPTGQTWATLTNETGVLEVDDGVMRWKTASVGETIYPYVVLANDVHTIGAEVEWLNVNQANANGSSAVLIIATNGENLEMPFFHLTLTSGVVNLQWYPNGLSGGGSLSTTAFPSFQLGQRIIVQAEIDQVAGTARFYGSGFLLELTGLTIPTGMKTAMYELTVAAGTVKTKVQYHCVWANPRNPAMMGLTSPPPSPRLTELAAQPNQLIFRKPDGTESMRLQADGSGNNDLMLSDTLNIYASAFATVSSSVTVFGQWKMWSIKVGSWNGTDGKEINGMQHGAVALTAGTATVAATWVTGDWLIFVNRYNDGGTVSASYSITRSDGVSFTITGKDGTGATQTADTSLVVWWALKQ